MWCLQLVLLYKFMVLDQVALKDFADNTGSSHDASPTYLRFLRFPLKGVDSSICFALTIALTF